MAQCRFTSDCWPVSGSTSVPLAGTAFIALARALEQCARRRELSPAVALTHEQSCYLPGSISIDGQCRFTSDCCPVSGSTSVLLAGTTFIALAHALEHCARTCDLSPAAALTYERTTRLPGYTSIDGAVSLHFRLLARLRHYLSAACRDAIHRAGSCARALRPHM